MLENLSLKEVIFFNHNRFVRRILVLRLRGVLFAYCVWFCDQTTGF